MEQVNGRHAASSSSTCHVWVDRHVHKTAGTTVRNTMTNLQAHGYLQKLESWVMQPSEMHRFVQTLMAYQAPNDCAPLQNARFAIELHEKQTHFTDGTLKILSRLRNRSSCCRLVLTARVRAPLEHYISSWLWAGEPRFAQYNRTFEQWAPKNLQSLLFYRGDFSGWVDGAKRNWSKAFHFDGDDYRRLSGVLTEFDVLFPVDRFTDGMRLIAARLELPAAALPLMLNQIHVAPRHDLIVQQQQTAALAKRAKQHVCPNMTQCRALVEQLAPYDHQLFNTVTDSFGRLYELEMLPPPPHASSASVASPTSPLPVVPANGAPTPELDPGVCPCSCQWLANGIEIARFRHRGGDSSLLNLPNASSGPDLVLCGIGSGQRVGSDEQLGRLQDDLWRALAGSRQNTHGLTYCSHDAEASMQGAGGGGDSWSYHHERLVRSKWLANPRGGSPGGGGRNCTMTPHAPVSRP